MLGKGTPKHTTALPLSSLKSSPSLIFPRKTAMRCEPLILFSEIALWCAFITVSQSVTFRGSVKMGFDWRSSWDMFSFWMPLMVVVFDQFSLQNSICP